MKKFLIFSLSVLASPLWSATTVTPPINFQKGVDHSRTCTDIADNAACDSQNMIGDIFGTASKRNGSVRYISQAISTHPVNSLYRASLDQGTTTRKVLLMTTWDKIYVSTSDTFPVWRKIKDGLVGVDQHFMFANSNGKIVMTGDALTDPPFVYDIVRDSMTGLFDVQGSSNMMNLRAKYVLAPNGYLVLGNVMDVKDVALTGNSTYYGSRVQYSLFQQISSFTYARFINIRTDDGESLTGMTEKGGTGGNAITVYKPSSISSIIYTILNLQENGGDITVSNVVQGFGCISPMALVNAGSYDIVPTKDGIIFYDGGRKNRLNLIDEVRPVSQNIKPDYERIIKYGTYGNSVAWYYPKNQWYVFSFTDPFYSPSGRNNRVFVYDIQTGEWWPFKNWLVGSFTSYEGKGDDGRLLYGDSNDGYVYEADLDTENDDARKEISINTMDKHDGWLPMPAVDTSTVVEGSASLKMQNTLNTAWYSSMTRIELINFGEWNDKSIVSRDTDLLSFKLKMSSLGLTQNLNVDMQFGITISSFNSIHSSVTLTTSTLVIMGASEDSSSSMGWTNIEIRLSSFVFPASWNDINIQEAPFSRSLAIYGLKFSSLGIGSCTINIDDVRIVQGNKNPVEAFYLSKQFNFGNVAQKDFRQVILSRDKDASSSFSIDVFTDYGYYANKKNVVAEIPKEIFVCGYKGINGIARLKSSDFSLIDSTEVQNSNVYDYMNGVASENYLFMFDKVKNRIVVLDRNTPSIIISSYGTLGTGTTNFNTVNQMALSGDTLLVADTFNNHITQFDWSSKKLYFKNTFGELGLGSTNFMVPSGIWADQTNIWVSDDGNFSLKKFSISTGGFISDRRIDTNAIADSSIQGDGEFIYLAYNKVAVTPYYQDVVLERRTKGDMTLLNRTIIRPQFTDDISTYTLSGDIALIGKYIFVGFTKDLQTTGKYYVQKLLKDSFDIVDQYETDGLQFSVIGDGKSYNPISKSDKINLESIEGNYIQLKYYDKAIDNTFKLHNYSFALDLKTYEESQ